MIKKSFLFPECYVAKQPFCDDCNNQPLNMVAELTSNPPVYEYVCPKCNKKYQYNEREVIGEWKWKTI